MPLARWAVYQGGPQIWVAPTADDSDGWQASMRHIAIESGAFVVSVPQYIPGERVPATDFPAEVDREKVYGRGGAVIVEPTWGGVIAGPLYDREGIVVADCDLRTGLHAKRWFDAVGHYAPPLEERSRRLGRGVRRGAAATAAAPARARRRRPRTAARAPARAPRRRPVELRGVAQQRERALVRPCRAVDAVRDQRVVDVADGEDARLERRARRPSARAGSPSRRAARGGRAPAAATPAGKPPTSRSSRTPACGCLRISANSSSSSGPGFCSTAAGPRACPCRAGARRARARAGGRGRARAPRRPGRPASRPGACGPRSRCPSRPAVHERADPRAEERLLLRDEVARARGRRPAAARPRRGEGRAPPAARARPRRRARAGGPRRRRAA